MPEWLKKFDIDGSTFVTLRIVSRQANEKGRGEMDDSKSHVKWESKYLVIFLPMFRLRKCTSSYVCTLSDCSRGCPNTKKVR